MNDDDQSTPVKQYGPPKETSYTKVIGGCLLGIGIFIAIFLTIAWLAKENSKDIPTISDPIVDSRITVVYTILGPTGRQVHLTYKDDSGRTTELTAEIPWTTTFRIRSGYELSLSAQVDGTVSELICWILADDQLIQSDVESGKDALVECRGVAP